MTTFHLWHLGGLLLSIALAHALPRAWQMDAVALLTALLMAWLAPVSFALLCLGTLLVHAVGRVPGSGGRWPIAAVIVVGAVFLVSSGLQRHGDGAWRTLELLGIAYYTARLVHLLFEGIGGAGRSSLRDLCRYQFFWPVLVTGPIHRFDRFQRECRRRRADPLDVHRGLERMLLGYAKVVLIATALLAGTIGDAAQATALAPWASTWADSALDWAVLYFLFAGWTDIALGASLAMGLRLEENFNRPWAARSLIEFWQRWHITLSAWCRDYVFAPLLAASRRPALALLGAMLAMGLWHEVSFYYVGWAAWHAAGIGACRLFQRWRDQRLPGLAPAMLSGAPAVAWSTTCRTLTFAWITAAPLAIGAVGALATGISP